MLKWSLHKIELPLRFNWKISRSETTTKFNFIVRLESSGKLAEGEVALSSRFGEDEAKIYEDFDRFIAIADEIENLETLNDILGSIEISNSLRFGIESAYVHLLAEISEKSIHQVLHLNQVKSINTSFSIPILPTGDIEKFFNDYNLARFKSIKIKVDNENMLDQVKVVSSLYQGPLRIDANESFDDPNKFIQQAESLKKFQIEFFEQPLKVGLHEEMKIVKSNIDVPLIADESIRDGLVTKELKEEFDGVNIKLMKSGGYLKALKQLRSARDLGLKTMLGCMVETSLGISSAMNIADNVDYFDLDGFLIIEKDPYKLVAEEKGSLFYSFIH